MRAISLIQPFASLIALGAKGIETRSWETMYRGPLAIHASARWGRAERELIKEIPFNLFDLASCPRGAVIAVVELVEVKRTEAWLDWFREFSGHGVAGEFEREFGDYGPGRFGWRFKNVRVLKEPIPAKGMLGLWRWDAPGELEFAA